MAWRANRRAPVLTDNKVQQGLTERLGRPSKQLRAVMVGPDGSRVGTAVTRSQSAGRAETAVPVATAETASEAVMSLVLGR